VLAGIHVFERHAVQRELVFLIVRLDQPEIVVHLPLLVNSTEDIVTLPERGVISFEALLSKPHAALLSESETLVSVLKVLIVAYRVH